jgi:arylsulfatase A-like enzyme
VRAGIAAACLVLGACGGAPRVVIHDLVREYPIAEVLQETPLIDAGTPAARRHLAAGWYPDEGGGNGPSFVWSEGDSSEIELFLLEPRPLEAELRCRAFTAPGAPGPAVEVEVDSEPVARLVSGGDFATHPLDLPAGRLQAGRNRLTLRYSGARSPRELGAGDDWRRLAVAMDWLRLEPGEAPAPPRSVAERSVLELPVGASVGYHLRFRDGLRLEVAGVSAAGGGRLRCVVVEAGRPGVAVGEVASGEGEARVELAGPPGKAFRLELQAIRVQPPDRRGGTIEVARPVITAPAATASASAMTAAPSPAAPAPRPNVVIYLVDALRADRLGVYGQRRPLSPRLDAFAATATVYDQAWAQSSWTRPAVASILTGLEPEVHGANGRLDRLGGGMATLAGRLAGAGWQTAAVVANPNASAAFGLDRGFEEFVLMPPERRLSTDLNTDVLRWLDGRDSRRPFLLYIHTVDPHLPYDPPAPFRERFAAGVERRDLGSTEVVGALLARDLVDEGGFAADLLDLYEAEVASNDHAFGELLDELARRGLDEGTVVIFLSDHGEEFFDHGGWIHGRTLHREVLQVPLVIRLPGQREGRRESAPAAHVDLMPTILELAGLTPEPGLHGRSLLAAPDPQRAVAAFLDLDGWGGWSTVQGGRHAIRHRRLGYTGPAELYDLEADPAERRDLGGTLAATAGALIDEARRETLDEAGRWTTAPAVIDDELRQRLEALGYL